MEDGEIHDLPWWAPLGLPAVGLVAVLDTPMTYSDIGPTTIRGYLKACLTAFWQEGEGFSGKRPLGNSDWYCQVVNALAAAGRLGEVETEVEDDWTEYLPTEEQYRLADKLVHDAIQEL
jgi:hypothetical protein